ncbi:MAG: flavin reductase family protein [Clostridia bacterium]
MSKRILNAGTLLAPVPPVMVSCGDMENSNIITIAWTGIINSDPPKTYISIRKSRFSHEIIKSSGEFVINLITSEIVKKADYCGIYTGAKVNKYEKCAFEKTKAQKLNCPVIVQSPINIECRVTDILELGSHDMFLADIVSVSADEALFDKKGQLHLEKGGLVAFSHGDYFKLGEKLGHIGFSTKK